MQLDQDSIAHHFCNTKVVKSILIEKLKKRININSKHLIRITAVFSFAYEKNHNLKQDPFETFIVYAGFVV